MKILCIGRPAYDITLPLDSFPQENTKTKCYKKFECGGGSASNCAYLLGKWNQEVSFSGVLGNDAYGKKIIKEFESKKVDITNINVIDIETPIGYIISNMNEGTRTIITYNSSYPELEFNENMTADYILIDGYYPETVKKVFEHNPQAIKIMDAGKLDEENYELAKLVDYVVCSKTFAEGVSGIEIVINNSKNLKKIFKIMEEKFPGKIIVTLEEDGCMYKDNDIKVIPTIPVVPVDTTGAGDIFHGAFVYAISNKYSLKDSLILSNITATLSCKKIGSRQSVPEIEEVLTIFNQQKNNL